MVTTRFDTILNGIDFDEITRHPNILIAARFWDQDRYEAAKACYGLMRSLDDMIDDRKAEGRVISEPERALLEAEVARWIDGLRTESSNATLRPVVALMDQFRIPTWPLSDFAAAMRYDLDHDGFARFADFLSYAGGASVAPSSIFVHLCCLRESNGEYLPAEFDVRQAAFPCSIFSYLVHIIRDFQEDSLNNLNYFACDIMESCGVTVADLARIARGASPSAGFRRLIARYLELAEPYRLETIDTIERIAPLLAPRYQLSLEIIFSLYLMVWERIDPHGGRFTTEELNPTAGEIRDRVHQVVESFRPRR